MTLQQIIADFPMATVVLDRGQAERLREQRKEFGSDRWDEVWEGTYIMSPLPNNQHQNFVGRLTMALADVLASDPNTFVLPGTNVSDQQENWKHNFRCPDVAVFLSGTKAENRDTHWFGGPDFAIEIVSPDDRTREKIGFYASVHTRELLIVDRDPWQLELFRLDGDQLVSAGVSTPDHDESLASSVLPFTFQLTAGESRPVIQVVHTESDKRWSI